MKAVDKLIRDGIISQEQVNQLVKAQHSDSYDYCAVCGKERTMDDIRIMRPTDVIAVCSNHRMYSEWYQLSHSLTHYRFTEEGQNPTEEEIKLLKDPYYIEFLEQKLKIPKERINKFIPHE